MDDELTPLQAADYLRRRMRVDNDIKLMVTAAVTKGGHADLFDWASGEPDQARLVAAAARDLEEQTAEFARRLAVGDLS